MRNMLDVRNLSVAARMDSNHDKVIQSHPNAYPLLSGNIRTF